MFKQKGCFLLVMALVFMTVSYLYPVKQVEAHTKVSTFGELKEVCARQGEDTIEILNDLLIEGPVVVRGNKKIDGHGYCLERSKIKGKVYGGCMFLVQSGKCEWKNVTISGGGKSKYVSGKVFGRLVEVRQGNLIIGEKCVFCDNINDRLAVDGGGAIKIGSGGSCTMKDGEIRNNQNVSRGAAFLIERGGRLIIKGGFIRDNVVAGAGAVKGFDGRGGAIYSEGKVTIQGGTIAGNRSYSYQEGGVRYGGMGAAVYADTGSDLYINGGVLTENRDDKNSPLWIKGDVILGGKPVLERIYLSSSVYIRTGDSFCPRGKVVVQPENCRPGVCIAKGKRTPFELVSNRQYKLERRRGGCYIVKISSKPKSKPESEKVPKNSPSPQKRKTEKPMVYCKKTHFVFYVGETVNREVMLYGVRAEDSKEGDITKDVRIVQPKGGFLSTDRERHGEIRYEVQNQRGVKTQKKVTYQIKKNGPPKVRIAPRFLFVSEVDGYTMQQWKDLLLRECRLTDDCESAGELICSAEVELGELVQNKVGTWDVELAVQDQYGHRFYMKKGEKKRYGKGCRTVVKIPVTLVDYSELGLEDAGYVRFAESGEKDEIEEEWTFTAGQIQCIKTFMDGRVDPFGQETNQEFLRIFQDCKRCEEEIGK